MFGKSLRVGIKTGEEQGCTSAIKEIFINHSLAYTTDIALSYINLNKYEIKAKGVERMPLLTKIKH